LAAQKNGLELWMGHSLVANMNAKLVGIIFDIYGKLW